MKITRIKLNGKKIDQYLANNLGAQLVNRLADVGFITDNIGLQKIGMHMRCFKIDTYKLGHNKRTDNQYHSSLVGWKRTDVPTWDQRVEFNDIINEFFDEHKIVAKIVSAEYLIRCHLDGANSECDWEGEQRSDLYGNSLEIESLTSYEIDQAKRIRSEHAKKKRLAKKAEARTKLYPKLKLE